MPTTCVTVSVFFVSLRETRGITMQQTSRSRRTSEVGERMARIQAQDVLLLSWHEEVQDYMIVEVITVESAKAQRSASSSA